MILRLLFFLATAALAKEIVFPWNFLRQQARDVRLRLFAEDTVAVEIELDRRSRYGTYIVNMRIVDEYREDEPFMIATTTGGDLLRMHDHYEPEPGQRRDWSRKLWTFTVEIKACQSRQEALETAMRVFSPTDLTLNSTSFKFTPNIVSNWTGLVLDAFSNVGFSVTNVFGFGEESQFTELQLLNLILQSSAKNVTFIGGSPSEISDVFYRYPAVRRLETIWLPGTRMNGITDETLADLKVKRISLGNAPKVTPSGIHSYLQSAIENLTETRKIELIPTFEIDLARVFFKDNFKLKNNGELDLSKKIVSYSHEGKSALPFHKRGFTFSTG